VAVVFSEDMKQGAVER